MYRRRNLSRNQVIRRRRPTERIVRAGVASLPSQTSTPPNVIGYVFTAKENGTVSNFKLENCIISMGTGTNTTVPYAVVYVPEGYNANNLTWPAVTDDMYNPTKNVLMSGILINSENRDFKSSRYSRKVVPGDRICLIYQGPINNPVTVGFTINFTQSC